MAGWSLLGGDSAQGLRGGTGNEVGGLEVTAAGEDRCYLGTRDQRGCNQGQRPGEQKQREKEWSGEAGRGLPQGWESFKKGLEAKV